MINVLKHKYIKRFASPWLVLAIDVGIISFAYILAAFVRFGFLFDVPFKQSAYQLPLVIAIYTLSFLIIGSYKGVVRYTNVHDMSRISLACIVALFLLLFIDFAINNSRYYLSAYDFRRSTLLIHFFISLNTLIFARLLFAFLFNKITQQEKNKKRALIYGAGEMGTAVDSIFENDNLTEIIGFIDDNPKKSKKRIHNKAIYHSSLINKEFLERLNVESVYIAINNIRSRDIRRITELFLEYNIRPKIVPAFKKWADGVLDTKEIKDVNIEDLLSREPIKLNTDLWNQMITKKTILVTGGAGSIGSEIVKQLLIFEVEKLVILDQSETDLFNLEQELRHLKYQNFETIVGNIRNSEAMSQLFEKFQPNTIFHAAAYKHVPLMERFPKEAIETNLLGTANLAQLAIKHKVKRFVLVSSDKAVNPTNVMGATKRACEIYINLLSKQQPQTKFITTRFGNVLGSNGSVIPLFRKQIAQNGPLTVTHKEIIRYFMTISEASQLVIEAGIMGNGGEIFVFDMGEPVKIFELAKQMIKLSGFKYPDDIDIKITGLRPGEKLYEELLQNHEDHLPTHNKKIMIAKIKDFNLDELNPIFEQLFFQTKDLSNDEVVALLKKIVPEYISKNSEFEKLDVLTKN